MPIAAVSRALRDLAARACAGMVDDDAVFVRQVAEIPYLQGDGVAVVLLRAGYDSARRQTPSGSRSSVPLDLHYALIPFAMEALQQHHLLAVLFRAIAENPVLPVESGGTGVTVIIETPEAGSQDATGLWPACLRVQVRGAVIGD